MADNPILTPEALQALRRLEQAATPGPWAVSTGAGLYGVTDDSLGPTVATTPAESHRFVRYGTGFDWGLPEVLEPQPGPDVYHYNDDAYLIREVRNALPALLYAADERDRLAAILARVQAGALVPRCPECKAEGSLIRLPEWDTFSCDGTKGVHDDAGQFVGWERCQWEGQMGQAIAAGLTALIQEEAPHE